MIRLSKSGIEYLDFVWNFYSGCEHWIKQLGQGRICHVGEDCWARETTKRFERHYPNGFKPTFYPEAFLSPLDLKKPSVIGVAFMGDLFGDWVDPNMVIDLPDSHGESFAHMALKDLVFTIVQACPQHTFVFLTKCPWNLAAWGQFPDNCHVGATVCTDYGFTVAAVEMSMVEAKVKWLSFEPLLSEIDTGENWTPPYMLEIFNWFVIGSYQIRSYTAAVARADEFHISQDQIMKYNNNWTLQPEIEWVKKLVDAADAAGIKVFLKYNLLPLLRPLMKVPNLSWFGNVWGLRQEVPCRK